MKGKRILCWIGLGCLPFIIYAVTFDYIVNVPMRRKMWIDKINSLDCVNYTCIIDDFSSSTPFMYLMLIICLCILGLGGLYLIISIKKEE